MSDETMECVGGAHVFADTSEPCQCGLALLAAGSDDDGAEIHYQVNDAVIIVNRRQARALDVTLGDLRALQGRVARQAQEIAAWSSFCEALGQRLGCLPTVTNIAERVRALTSPPASGGAATSGPDWSFARRCVQAGYDKRRRHEILGAASYEAVSAEIDALASKLTDERAASVPRLGTEGRYECEGCGTILDEAIAPFHTLCEDCWRKAHFPPPTPSELPVAPKVGVAPRMRPEDVQPIAGLKLTTEQLLAPRAAPEGAGGTGEDFGAALASTVKGLAATAASYKQLIEDMLGELAVRGERIRALEAENVELRELAEEWDRWAMECYGITWRELRRREKDVKAGNYITHEEFFKQLREQYGDGNAPAARAAQQEGGR